MQKSHDPVPLPLVIAPTPLEFAAVRRAIMPLLIAGKLTLAQCGMGPQLATAFSEGLDKEKVSCIILLGWAGGLVSALKAGDFVCASQAMYPDRIPINCKPVQISSASIGPILTVPKALFSPQEKHQAQSSGAVAVEMEAYPLALKAQQLGLPFIHARIILDSYDETIPDLSIAFSVSGKVELIPFLRLLRRRPGMMKELWKLNQRIHSLNPILGELAFKICTSVLDKI